MDSNLLILVIIILIIFYITTQSKGKSNMKIDNSMVLCLLLFGILVFFVYRDFNKTTEQFYNQHNGNYPNIFEKQCYRKDGKKNNRNKLQQNVIIHSPVGEKNQLTQDMTSDNFPTVDGQKGSDRHMFMFAKNQCHPDCCPGTYSCDKGCLCITKQQKNMLQSRGSNLI